MTAVGKRAFGRKAVAGRPRQGTGEMHDGLRQEGLRQVGSCRKAVAGKRRMADKDGEAHSLLVPNLQSLTCCAAAFLQLLTC